MSHSNLEPNPLANLKVRAGQCTLASNPSLRKYFALTLAKLHVFIIVKPIRYSSS